MWDAIKKGLQNLAKFFGGLFNLASYPDLQKQVSSSLTAFSAQMKAIETSLNANKEETAKLSKKMDDFNLELTKVKDGLQMELFSSLQVLHTKLINQLYASKEDKMEAKLYYEQIHILGKDGWSKKYYDEIINLPESKEEYYKSLK